MKTEQKMMTALEPTLPVVYIICGVFSENGMDEKEENL